MDKARGQPRLVVTDACTGHERVVGGVVIVDGLEERVEVVLFHQRLQRLHRRQCLPIGGVTSLTCSKRLVDIATHVRQRSATGNVGLTHSFVFLVADRLT